MRRTLGNLLLAAAAGAMLCLAQPATAAQILAVDFTVHETLPVVAQGRIVRGNLEGCANATVKTLVAGSSTSRGVTTYNGSKKISCDGGNSLTLTFKVKVPECAATATGTWKVTRGTGVFASARGEGTLIGAYSLGRKPGTSCNADGIEDRYIGKLQY